MRSALCLYGKVGGTQGKDGSGSPIDFTLCCSYLKKHIIDINNCDVFMHSWSVEFEKQLTELYQPKKKIFEPQIKFDTKSTVGTTRREEFTGRSRWYSTKQVLELKSLCETEQRFKYDWVMLARYDLVFFVDFDFSKLEPGFLYASHFNDVRGKPTMLPNRGNRTPSSHRFLDLWFIGASELIDKFGLLWENFYSYDVTDAHEAIWNHLSSSICGSIDLTKITKYIFYRWFDYEIYRIWKGTGK